MLRAGLDTGFGFFGVRPRTSSTLFAVLMPYGIESNFPVPNETAYCVSIHAAAAPNPTTTQR